MRIKFTDWQCKPDASIRHIYDRTLTHWVCDLHHSPPEARWPKTQTLVDYRSRDWQSLYTGNLLDD